MTKDEALALIDAHKNALLNPVEMLNWTWLRVIVLNLSDDTWAEALERAHGTLSR